MNEDLTDPYGHYKCVTCGCTVPFRDLMAKTVVKTNRAGFPYKERDPNWYHEAKTADGVVLHPVVWERSVRP